MNRKGADDAFAIGRLAAESGTKVQTIRYYEEIGVLAPPPRTAGNQRVYRRRDLERLIFIRRGRALGFSLDEIRRLLALADHGNTEAEASCADAHAIASAHLVAVREKIAHLRELERALDRMVIGCANETVADCRILEALADGPRSTG